MKAHFQFLYSIFILAVVLCWLGCGSTATAVESGDALVPEPFSDVTLQNAVFIDAHIAALESALNAGALGIARNYFEDIDVSQLTAGQAERVLNLQLRMHQILGDASAANRVILEMIRLGIEPSPLTVGLSAFFLDDIETAKQQVAGVNLSAYSNEERSWWALLEALISSAEGQVEEANISFQSAERLAPSDGLRQHFELIRIRAEMASSSLSDVSISSLRESIRSLRGERSGFEAARLLAMALHKRGEGEEAIELLNRHLAMPGIREFSLRADFLLLMGFIAGPDATRGRLALRQVIAEPSTPVKQALAFQMLVSVPLVSDRREQLKTDLADWLERFPDHSLREQFLVHLAYLNTLTGSFDDAQNFAERLLSEFPSSSYTPYSLRLLATISWTRQPPQFRTAADYLNQLRQILPDGPERQRLSVLIADCFFLNGDFVSASDAYGAASRDAAPDLAGRLLFQRVNAEIRSARIDFALNLLDVAHADGVVPAEDLWRAEWNLLSYLRKAGRTEEAFNRINRLLGGSVQPLSSVELAVRLNWLLARLSLEHGQLDLALSTATGLRDRILNEEFNSLDTALLDLVDAHLMLLIGEVHLQRGDSALAGDLFADLRAQYSDSGPSILSYLVEARSASGSEDAKSMQDSLLLLVDRFPHSSFAPLALWEAALNAEQRGLNAQFQVAIGILDRLVNDYPQHPLVFFARVRQGDLARRLNDFPSALLLYERAISQFPQHPERFRAELSKADVLMALGSEDPAKLEAATLLYERNTLLPNLPPPARTESGYKWARSLRRNGDLRGNQTVLWLVYSRLLLDPNINSRVFLSDAGRYWAARTLLDLGDLLAENGSISAARQIYTRHVSFDLPGSELANQRLQRLL